MKWFELTTAAVILAIIGGAIAMVLTMDRAKFVSKGGLLSPEATERIARVPDASRPMRVRDPGHAKKPEEIITVTGKVESGGFFLAPRGVPLTMRNLLDSVGGITASAARIEVLRIVEGGVQVVHAPDPQKYRSGEPDDFEVKPGDVVAVK